MKIEELANLDADFSSQISSVTSVGNYPKGKESYGLDYLMALMVPRNQSPYDRTQHYNPITKEFLPDSAIFLHTATLSASPFT